MSNKILKCGPNKLFEHKSSISAVIDSIRLIDVSLMTGMQRYLRLQLSSNGPSEGN